MSLPTTTGGTTYGTVTSTALTNYGNGVFLIHTLNARAQYSIDGGGIWYDFPLINQNRVMRLTAKELIIQKESGTLTAYLIPEEAEMLV